jgi:hypothetical protein
MEVSLSKLTYLDWITAIAFLIAFVFFLNPKLKKKADFGGRRLFP